MVTTSVLHGMEAILVQVEADVSPGLPTFEMVGFLSSEVKEAKERVRTALRNCGYQLPAKRITISFSPAGIRKSGSGFDLAVAVAILAALEAVPKKRVENTIFLGELNLSGKLVPIPGILPMAAVAAEWTESALLPWFFLLREGLQTTDCVCLPPQSHMPAIAFFVP